MIRPPALQKGDTIGIIAPASLPDLDRLKKALPFFKNMGLRVKLGKTIYQTYGYLAGNDQVRLDDFHEMIEDKEVKAIIFARGGYGTARIASKIDYSLVANNPKIIWGYSDITYLHTAIRQETGLVTFHGPMVSSDIADDEFDSISAQFFYQLFKPMTLFYTDRISSLHVIRKGVASGELVGGNLTLLTSTLGTKFEIDTAGKILLIEDVNEEPYRVDSMLNQLKLAGKLDHAAGIVVGDFSKAKPRKQPSFDLAEVFDSYFHHLTVPVIQGAKMGHCFPHIGVPLGVLATIVTEEKKIEIQPGVISS
jgi:muramoyltetrapeptide carboxypeptidase